jgi:hypothetical protein
LELRQHALAGGKGMLAVLFPDGTGFAGTV